MSELGIVSYGHYIPTARMSIGALTEQWQTPAENARVYALNGRRSTAVTERDEDVVTLAVEAAERALLLCRPGFPAPTSVIVGSESQPYLCKAGSVVVADALGLTPNCFVGDVQFACKGGTSALLISKALVGAGEVESALAIAADVPLVRPGMLLEASLGAGASAFVVGADGVLATIDATASAASDLTDLWRRDNERFYSMVGRFSGDVGYMEHIAVAAAEVMRRSETRPQDFRFACFHQPFAALAYGVGQRLGFSKEQVRPAIVSGSTGNTCANATAQSLCAALELAHPGDRILAASFGSGAGSDALVLTVTDEVYAFRERYEAAGLETLQRELAATPTRMVTYGQYAAMQNKLRT